MLVIYSLKNFDLLPSFSIVWNFLPLLRSYYQSLKCDFYRIVVTKRNLRIAVLFVHMYTNLLNSLH